MFKDLVDITEFVLSEEELFKAHKEGWVLEYEC
jgi:hypothetical protein